MEKKRLSKEERQQLFICDDCGVNTSEIHEYYMVHDDIWRSVAGDSLEGMLCIGCLEDRLGRRLTAEDFTDCILNNAKVSLFVALKNWRFADCSNRLRSRLLT